MTTATLARLPDQKEPTCTTKCPAIRDDKGSWYCRIQRAYVAPSEHHLNYGFDIIKAGKITHSGYSTPCNAMGLFNPHASAPAPVGMTADELWDYSNDLAEVAAKAAREQTLTEVYDELISSQLIRGDCMRDAIHVIEYLRSQQEAEQPKEEQR
jgi:hypothetical protein